MKSILLLTTLTSLALAQVQIPDGTKIRVRLEQAVSSATAEEGQTVPLSVADPVRVGNAIAIPQGAAVTGSVVSASQKRRLGRSGKLDFSIDRVRAIDGQWIPVRYAITKKDGGNRMLATESGQVLSPGVAQATPGSFSFQPSCHPLPVPFNLLLKRCVARVLLHQFLDDVQPLAVRPQRSQYGKLSLVVPPSSSLAMFG